MNTLVRIELVSGEIWKIRVKPEALNAVGGLVSGKVVSLDRHTSDLQFRTILIKPYYRRVISRELHVFAMQVEAAS